MEQLIALIQANTAIAAGLMIGAGCGWATAVAMWCMFFAMLAWVRWAPASAWA